MTKEQEEELRTYYEIYAESWKLFKKHYPPTNTEEFWGSLMNDCRALTKKYQGQARLVTELLLATNNEIVRMQKREEESCNQDKQNQTKV